MLVVPDNDPMLRDGAGTALRAAGVAALVGGLGILIVFLAAEVADLYIVSKIVLRDVGIAFIVAAVIIFAIEQKSRDELNRMVSRFLQRTHENLFQTILGVEFPKTMFDFVRDRLMKEPIFRTETEVHYTIRALNDNAGLRFGIQTVLLDVTFSYKIKNLSDRQQTHPIRITVEEPLDQQAPVDRQLPRLLLDGQQVAENEMRHADPDWQDRPGLRRFEYQLVMAPQEERSVETQHSMTKLIADSENWRSLHPCDGLRLSITHPAELAVGVDAMHPDDLVTIQENTVSYVGKIPRPLFPQNGFLFWWHPRTPPEGQRPGNGGEPENPAELPTGRPVNP